MVKNPINIGYIFKRKRYLEKTKLLPKTNMNISFLKENNFAQNKVKLFFENYTSYDDALYVLEELYNRDKKNLVRAYTQTIINDIIPLVENSKLDDCIDKASNLKIDEYDKNTIIDTIKMYKKIDRINENHNIISKRFEMKLKNKSNREKCFNVCEMVDTYNSPIVSKFNIAIEEIKYINFMNGFTMNDSEIVKNVCEYFMMCITDDDSRKDYSIFKECVTKSKLLDMNAMNEINYVYSSNKNINWNDKLNNWMKNPNKNINELSDIIYEYSNNITILNELICIMNEFVNINNLEFDPITIFNEDRTIDADGANNIIKLIKENNIKSTDDLLINLDCIWEAEKNDISYYNNTKNTETFSSDDIDNFKMHNLISDSIVAGKLIDKLEKNNNLLKNKNTFPYKNDINKSNYINNIDVNGFITIPLRSYTVNKDCLEETTELVENCVNSINNSLYNRNSIGYFLIDENNISIFIRSKYKVILNETETINKNVPNIALNTLATINSYYKSMQNLVENTNIINIIKKLKYDRYFASSVPFTKANMISEMINPFIEKDDVITEFTRLCINENNPDSDKIKYIKSNLCEEKLIDPLNIDTDRLILCEKTINAKPNVKSNIKNTDSSGNGVGNKIIDSINDAKIIWQGVKSKLKNLSSKEKEISRDMDIEFNHLIKTIQSAGPDHRREIITGEVNHSLSRTIKMGISLAGIGVATQSWIIPVIGAIALFAKSKFATDKEKRMIIDEIDIELKILNRELNSAESSGSTQKYRQLLTIQKNLQRKRQEIYYGLARKGKRIPVEKTDND